jgi:hypothetical protein
MFDLATPALATMSPLDVTVHGTPGSYGVSLNGMFRPDAAVEIDGTGTVSVPLAVGRNALCTFYTAMADVGGNSTRAEAKNCIEIVYVP